MIFKGYSSNEKREVINTKYEIYNTTNQNKNKV